MKGQGAQQRWWTALSGWLERHQGRADFLFVYDKKQGRLDRCFDRNVVLDAVDAETIKQLYQAAAEGRLGLLRPNDLKPQLLTTNPEKIFAADKDIAAAKEQTPAKKEQPSAMEEQAPLQEQKTSDGEMLLDRMPGLDGGRVERAAADPDVANRLREAESHYRQVVYAPKTPAAPAPAEVPNGENSAAKRKEERAAAVDRSVEQIRNAMPLQPDEGIAQEQEQLIADLVQMALGSDEDAQNAEREEREREAREALIDAQNMFIWAAVSDQRDREEFESRMEWLDLTEKRLEEQAAREREWEWTTRVQDMSRELYDMDLAGASEEDCKEKIRDYLDGKTPAKQPNTSGEEQEEHPVSKEMLGNALRHFCRFAASEVPLSVRHVQVAQHCCRILQQTKQMGLSMEDMGLDAQEQTVVQGTMEMGTLVEQGLLAQAALTSGNRLPPKEYRECLRSYLAMKGIEETLIPHVQAYQKEISTGDGPVSALQILMANKGFRANDLRVKAGRTEPMNRLMRMNPLRVGQMIKRGGGEIAAMGQQVMIASCQMDVEPEPVREPVAPQKGGPML